MTTIVMESKYKRERLLAVLTSRQVWRGCLTYPPSIIHNVCTHQLQWEALALENLCTFAKSRSQISIVVL